MADNEPAEFILYEITSGKVVAQPFASTATLNTEHLTKGIYFYEIRDEKRVLLRGKVLKN